VHETIETNFRAEFWHFLGETYHGHNKSQNSQSFDRSSNREPQMVKSGTADSKQYGSYELLFQITEKL
jgi:hypothetical protein